MPQRKHSGSLPACRKLWARALYLVSAVFLASAETFFCSSNSHMNTDFRHESTDHLNAVAQCQRTEHDGRVMTWRAYGAGTPLVLLHGGHGSWLHWARNIETLAASHHVLVPDLPGFGESDALPPETSFPGFVDAIGKSIDTLLGPGADIDLVGFSFGGLVAAELAARRKGVRKLALLGPAGHGERRRQAAALINWRFAKDEQKLLANLGQNLAVSMLHGPVDSLALEIHRYSCVHTRYRSKATSRTPILPTTLKQLDLPIFMLWGEHDATGVPEEIGPMLQDGRRERKWEIIRASGHWVQHEAAEEVNQRLLDWFSLR